VPLLFGEVLCVVLACPMGRIRVVNHVNADARLTSPDIGDAALNRQVRRVLVTLIGGRAALSQQRIGRQLLSPSIMDVLQGQVRLVHVDFEVDLMLGHEIDARADRRDSRGRVELHQSRLQLECIHSRYTRYNFFGLPTHFSRSLMSRRATVFLVSPIPLAPSLYQMAFVDST
jgi:hypothetical protein